MQVEICIFLRFFIVPDFVRAGNRQEKEFCYFNQQ